MAKENHLSYKVTVEGAAKIERLRQKYIELDDLIDEVTAEQGAEREVLRARAVAKTELETSRMWAVISVVRLHNDGPAEVQGSVSGTADKQAA